MSATEFEYLAKLVALAWGNNGEQRARDVAAGFARDGLTVTAHMLLRRAGIILQNNSALGR